MAAIAEGVTLAIERGRGFKKTQPEASTLNAFEFWEEALGKGASVVDGNFFRLFRECGHELRFLPMTVPPKNPEIVAALSRDVIPGHCHITAFRFARAMCNEMEGVAVWFGFVDDFELNKGYEQTMCHSFLTLSEEIAGVGQTTIFDPLQLLFTVQGKTGYMTNHCGVPMPYGVLEKMHGVATRMGLPWSHYLSREVLSSKQATDELIESIKEEFTFS